MNPESDPKETPELKARKFLYPIGMGALVGLMVGGGYLWLNPLGEEEQPGAPLNIASAADPFWEEQEMAFPELAEETFWPEAVQEDQMRTVSEKRLLERDQTHYTLQLLGARKEDNVQRFIQQNALQEKADYYRTTLSGKEWYVVVYGDYPDLQAAKAALQSMPEHLKKAAAAPWIRDLKSVQQDIQKD